MSHSHEGPAKHDPKKDAENKRKYLKSVEDNKLKDRIRKSTAKTRK